VFSYLRHMMRIIDKQPRRLNLGNLHVVRWRALCLALLPLRSAVAAARLMAGVQLPPRRERRDDHRGISVANRCKVMRLVPRSANAPLGLAARNGTHVGEKSILKISIRHSQIKMIFRGIARGKEIGKIIFPVWFPRPWSRLQMWTSFFSAILRHSQ